MLKPIDAREKDLIVRNVIAACKNIERLNGRGYKFLYLCSGFIAHYDVNGFKAYYGDGRALMRDIAQFKRFNQWSNFAPGERDAEYYHSKRDVYNKICECLGV